MGQIVGAAIVSHHPGLMQSEEFRVLQGNGSDSDLIAGYERIRSRIDAVRPDVLMIFDTHWFTTGYHLIDGGARYSGRYISFEMPSTVIRSCTLASATPRAPPKRCSNRLRFFGPTPAISSSRLPPVRTLARRARMPVIAKS